MTNPFLDSNGIMPTHKERNFNIAAMARTLLATFNADTATMVPLPKGVTKACLRATMSRAAKAEGKQLLGKWDNAGNYWYVLNNPK